MFTKQSQIDVLLTYFIFYGRYTVREANSDDNSGWDDVDK